MSNFQDLTIKSVYFEKGSEILESFLLPVLNQTVSYKRITSFFSIDSLISIANGISAIREKNGKIQIIIGVHNIPVELLDVVLQHDWLEEEVMRIREILNRDIKQLQSVFEKEKLATLAWMMEDGLLSVKIAQTKDGIFHPKLLIMKDVDGNMISASGSTNETRAGLGGNVENLDVFTSWADYNRVSLHEKKFIDLWNDRIDDVLVGEITYELAETLFQELGLEKQEKPQEPIQSLPLNGEDLKKIPAYHFVSGTIPALYQYQERAVIDALSRWPIRVLFADEVGLGKTFEVASVLSFLLKFTQIKRVVILTPKSLLFQWQEELKRFSIKAWIYDSATSCYTYNNDSEWMKPLDANAPDICLISAQFARGSKKRGSIFDNKKAVLPEVLILDEAHSARVSISAGGTRSTTRMYQMIEEIAPKIPHLIFATATPMQKDWQEYHAMLKLLGLPKNWKKERNYHASLTCLALSAGELPETTDANVIGKLLIEVIQNYKPNIEIFSNVETKVLEDLICKQHDLDFPEYVISKWSIIQNVLVHLHPAHLLTIRNTRSSLEKLGYQFPKRQFKEISLDGSKEILSFYQRIKEYLSSSHFSIERQLYPNKTFTEGFIQMGYEQRLVSSLSSCINTLRRRLEKLNDYLIKIKNGVIPEIDESIDLEEDEDEFLRGADFSKKTKNLPSLNELERVTTVEIATIKPLISSAQNILDTQGDAKINEALKLIYEELKNGNQILLFSRYTDTLDFMIDCLLSDNRLPVFGVYTGKGAVIYNNGNDEEISKRDLQQIFQSNELKVLICSDAASEGLNLHSAHILVNIDIPWTPARLEQRIGRIARLGQKSEIVYLYNIWYRNSIEEHMFRQLNRRKELYDWAVGEYPEVMGKVIKNIVSETDLGYDPLEELNDLRKSIQTTAIQRLFSESEKESTKTKVFRQDLMTYLIRNLVNAPETNEKEIIEVDIEDESFTYSTEPNWYETINLSSKIWKYIPLEIQAKINYLDGRPYGLSLSESNEKCIVAEKLISILNSGDTNDNSAMSDERPIWLPNPDALDFSFSCDSLNQDRPKFWPDKNKE